MAGIGFYALYQLSYRPIKVVEQVGLEPTTSSSKGITELLGLVLLFLY